MELIAERPHLIENTTLATPRAPGASRRSLRAGWILSGVAIAFLAFDAVAKLLEVRAVLEGTAQLGYPPSSAFGMGVVLLVCVVAYAVPPTSLLGAILLTGYLGGAIATHVRVGSPLFTHVLFPIYVAVLIWGGIYLRDGRLRAMIPLRRAHD